jgi:hypothetical protein
MKFNRPAPIRTTFNVSALAREYGVSRSTVRERLRKGWRPRPAPLVKYPAPGMAAMAPNRQSTAIQRAVGGAILAIAAISIGGLALTINAQYGASIGDTALTSWTFTGLAIVVDLLALALAPAAVGLWRTKQRGLAIATWTTWGVAAFLAILATLGYLQKNLADAAATRAATKSTAIAREERRSDIIAAAKLAVSVAKASREAECATRGPRCLQREVDERAAVNALSAAVASPTVSPAKISDPDPQIAVASRLAAWLGLRISSDDFANVRLVLWSLILNSGGLVLAVAFGLPRRGIRE